MVEGCRSPVENLLGEEGEGVKVAMQTFGGGRNGIAAQAGGFAQGGLAASGGDGRERYQVGKPIAGEQGCALQE